MPRSPSISHFWNGSLDNIIYGRNVNVLMNFQWKIGPNTVEVNADVGKPLIICLLLHLIFPNIPKRTVGLKCIRKIQFISNSKRFSIRFMIFTMFFFEE